MSSRPLLSDKDDSIETGEEGGEDELDHLDTESNASYDRTGFCRENPLAHAAVAYLILLLLGGIVFVSFWRMAPKSPLLVSVAESTERSWLPSPFWGLEVDQDEATQGFLKSFYRRRKNIHLSKVQEAHRLQKSRNDRAPGNRTPLYVYWRNPQSFWKETFGTGQGEHLEMKDCSVACTLVSGFMGDPNMNKHHVLLDYNDYQGPTVNDPLPFQKLALYALEASPFISRNRPALEVFDILASLSHYGEIYLETYVPRVKAGGKLLGLADITTSEMADEVWGPNRDKSPAREYFEGVNVPAELLKGQPLRLATFISNCHAPSRNRLMSELMKEGIEFDHYGKCNETFFGGNPPPYSLAFADEIAEISGPAFAKLAVLSLYQFNLVIENTIMSDYVTEKFTEGLVAGIPIILGAPNLADDLQPPGSPPVFINALQYNPSELAAVMRKLANDQEAAAEYRSWIKTIPARSKLIDYVARMKKNDATKASTYLEQPICRVCEYYHEYYDWEGDAPSHFS